MLNLSINFSAKVLIHDPEDFPQTAVTTSIGQPGYDVAIAVLPSVIVSQPQIRGLPQLQRNCLFEDEVQSDVKCKVQN